MGRPRQLPQAAANAGQLISSGVPRERAILAERISTLRAGKNWNWAELADKAQMSGKQIQGIEEGRREVQLATMIKLVKALDLHSLDEIVGPLPLEGAGLI